MGINYNIKTTESGEPISLTVLLNMRPHTIEARDGRYLAVLNAIRTNVSEADLIDLIDKKAVVERATSGLLEIRGSKVYAGEIEIPMPLVNRLFTILDNGLDPAPFEQFVLRIMDNPSFRVVHQLSRFMENANLPLTEDGCFLAYKRVNENYRDVYSDTFDNRVGQTPSMPRNSVNDNPSEVCSHGFHVCSWEYLSKFGGKYTMICKIDPSNVVSVPIDYKNTKMRVCAYEVIGVAPDDRIREDTYFSGPVYNDHQDIDPFEDLPTSDLQIFTDDSSVVYLAGEEFNLKRVTGLEVYTAMKEVGSIANLFDKLESQFGLDRVSAISIAKHFFLEGIKHVPEALAELPSNRYEYDDGTVIDENDDGEYHIGTTKLDLDAIYALYNIYKFFPSCVILLGFHYGFSLEEAAHALVCAMNFEEAEVEPEDEEEYDYEDEEDEDYEEDEEEPEEDDTLSMSEEDEDDTGIVLTEEDDRSSEGGAPDEEDDGGEPKTFNPWK